MGHSIYVKIHDGAFEDREAYSWTDDNLNLSLDVWDIDTLDFVTCGEGDQELGR